jgi:hypothetical protein
MCVVPTRAMQGGPLGLGAMAGGGQNMFSALAG